MTARTAPNRYELYEAAAQSPLMQAQFLAALVGERDDGTNLGEDFCGSGAISRAWIEMHVNNRAICVDHDAEPLARLRTLARDPARVRIHQRDVMDVDDACDVIVVLNFSICELHSRSALLSYLKHARRRLADASPAGLFVLDIYGGVDAFALGESDIELRDGVRYIWEQREADPLTGRVVNAMHFMTDHAELRDAFVYDWRLWSVPELREALAEAGFCDLAVYDRLGDAIDDEGRLYPRAIESADELDENFVVYVTARA